MLLAFESGDSNNSSDGWIKRARLRTVSFLVKPVCPSYGLCPPTTSQSPGACAVLAYKAVYYNKLYLTLLNFSLLLLFIYFIYAIQVYNKVSTYVPRNFA